MTKRSRTLRYKVLMVAVLLVVVAWTVVWFVVATVVDRHAERAEAAARGAGAIAECLNRSIRGFPFRIEVRCAHGSRIGNTNANVTVDGLTAAALIYKPSRLIFETQGPAIVAADGMPSLRADWDLAHASARIDIDRRVLQRLDIEVRDGTVLVGSLPPRAFAELDLNLRRNPVDPQALDVALSLADVRAGPGIEPLSFVFQGTLSDAAGLLEGQPHATLRALAQGELALAVERAGVETAAMALSATGALKIGPDGVLSGTIDLALAGDGADLPLDGLVSPEMQKTIVTLLDNVLAFAPQTRVGDRKAKQITLTIAKGQVAAGFVPLFKIPPLRIAASY